MKHGKEIAEAEEKEMMSEHVYNAIDNWVNKNDVCVFMNGNKYDTRCPISKRLMQILKDYSVKRFFHLDVSNN